MELIWNILAAFFSGAAASLGIGGGGILLLYLVLALHMQQLPAQGINLLFFLPCAILSMLFYTKKKLIQWKAVLPIVLGGICGVGLGAYLAGAIAPGYLGKIFGGFLILLGLRELFAKTAKKEAEKH